MIDRNIKLKPGMIIKFPNLPNDKIMSVNEPWNDIPKNPKNMIDEYAVFEDKSYGTFGFLYDQCEILNLDDFKEFIKPRNRLDLIFEN